MTRKDDSWLVLIDTSECGKLEEGVRLRPFRETGDVAHLTQEVRATIAGDKQRNIFFTQ